MKKGYLVGIDIGTQGSKGALLTLDGKVVATSYIEHGVSTPRPGWAEHDAERIWWGDLKKICRDLIHKADIDPKRIAAMGCSGLAPDVLPVNSQGKPLRTAILYGDARSIKETQWLNKKVGKKKIFEISGRSLYTQAAGPKILWLKNNEPEVFSKTFKILTATSYLVYKLTGNYVIDYCNADCFTPLFDFKKSRWSEEMCDVVGISPQVLPEIRFAGDIAGRVTIDASRETGLVQGTPIIVGTTDFAADILSTGTIKEGEAALLYGSTMLIWVIVKEPKFHPLLFSGTFVIPGSYRIGGAMATSGALTKWFRDNFAQAEREIEKRTGVNAYSLLSDQAQHVSPGSDGLVVLPYFKGERTPILDEKARGLIIGLTLSHTKAHLYRALLEGTAYGLQHHLEILKDLGVKVTKINAVGGGTKSNLWTQIISDVTGVEQRCLHHSTSSSIGDAYLAGYGVGVFKGFEIIRQKWIKIEKEVKPSKEAHLEYKKYYRIYRSLYRHVKREMHELAMLQR